MKMQHTPYHWALVALVLLAFMLTLSEAWGQARGAATQFEGRPAMAGAQGGQGAQAGVPQGGLGVQGSQAAEGADVAAARKEVTAPARDRGLAKDERSATRKIKRAAKRTITRAHHGTSEIDSTTKAGAPTQ